MDGRYFFEASGIRDLDLLSAKNLAREKGCYHSTDGKHEYENEFLFRLHENSLDVCSSKAAGRSEFRRRLPLRVRLTNQLDVISCPQTMLNLVGLPETEGRPRQCGPTVLWIRQMCAFQSEHVGHRRPFPESRHGPFRRRCHTA